MTNKTRACFIKILKEHFRASGHPAKTEFLEQNTQPLSKKIR